MPGDIDDFASRHTLSPEAAAELAELWAGHHSASTMDLSDSPARGPERVVAPDGPYEDLGLLGRGGTCEVRRVRDVRFDRVLAQKVVSVELLGRPRALARFEREALATARLQHPSIVPVYDMGRTRDGRTWFTMKEVEGRTLSAVIDDVHRTSSEGWSTTPSGWSLRRMITVFLAACRAVAYAHEQGVVHRDLKPENLMVGRHGEVYVVDWGLARLLGAGQDARPGQIAGTPAYMSPEQARGEVDRVDERSDVYALGATLYEILSGRPPFLGAVSVVLERVREGAPTPLIQLATGPAAPEELVEVCERAMARERQARTPSADVLADAVEAWLDGSLRRERALQIVALADELDADAARLTARSEVLRAEADASAAQVPSWAAEEVKAPLWALADEADRMAQAARLRRIEVDETLKGALQISEGLPEAHARLAQRYLERHAAAEAARRPRAALEVQPLLELHADALPPAHPIRRRVATYLSGEGALTLVTDPPGARVGLFRYAEHRRRLVPRFERDLGTTPLASVPVPMGSYLCVVEHPACETVKVPIEIVRNGHWDGVPPGAHTTLPVWLPPRGSLGPDEVYVPAGWSRLGGDREVASFPPIRAWCGPLLVERFPVTNRRYIAFLDDLVASGREEEALRHAPRLQAANTGETGALLYAFDGRRFSVKRDGQGDEWDPEYPVLYVDWFGARAWCRWSAERTGRTWRLPCELEWEHVARGVDGRAYPWGDQSDPSWMCITVSRETTPLPSVVRDFEVDESPYGVRGLAGNVMDWCLDPSRAPVPVVDGRIDPSSVTIDESPTTYRSIRGGSWFSAAQHCRSAYRNNVSSSYRESVIGFRAFASV